MKTPLILIAALIFGSLLVRLELNLYGLQAEAQLLKHEAIFRTLENPAFLLAGDSTPTPTPRKPATMHVTQRLNGPLDPERVLNQLGTQLYRISEATPSPTATATPRRPGSPQAHHHNQTLDPRQEVIAFARYEKALKDDE